MLRRDPDLLRIGPHNRLYRLEEVERPERDGFRFRLLLLLEVRIVGRDALGALEASHLIESGPQRQILFRDVNDSILFV